MTDATAAPYYVTRMFYAVRMEGHFIGTPMVCISLKDPNELEPSGHLAAELGELPGVVVMTAHQIAEDALRILGAKFRKCGVAHDEPYPARGAWAYLGGNAVPLVELPALVAALQDVGFYVAMETSPIATNHIGAGVDWVCIAANAEGNNADANAEGVGVADELRFFIYKPGDIDFAISFCAAYPPTEGQPRTISVQAVGQQNVPAQNECLTQALANGWRVSFIPYPEPREGRILTLDNNGALAAAKRDVLKSRGMLQ